MLANHMVGYAVASGANRYSAKKPQKTVIALDETLAVFCRAVRPGPVPPSVQDPKQIGWRAARGQRGFDLLNTLGLELLKHRGRNKFFLCIFIFRIWLYQTQEAHRYVHSVRLT